MKGKILHYSVENNLGYITSDDEKGYQFSSEDWKDNKILPKKNLLVDFEIEGNKAIDIFVILEMDSNFAKSSLSDNLLEQKNKLFAEVKNKDNLNKLYSKMKLFWDSTIYPVLKYLGKKIINYFDTLVDIPNSKKVNRTNFHSGEVQLGYNMKECKDCGHIVSKSAIQCPNCGAILKQDNISVIFGVIALFSAGLLFSIPIFNDNFPLTVIISFAFCFLTSYKQTLFSFLLGLISFLLNCYILLHYTDNIRSFMR